jgi:hypothetical protein
MCDLLIGILRIQVEFTGCYGIFMNVEGHFKWCIDFSPRMGFGYWKRHPGQIFHIIRYWIIYNKDIL